MADRKDVLWRHDVEFEPDIALRMAEIEESLGVKATYFFQLQSTYYSTLDAYYTQVLQIIKELGHYIGLHFDSHYYGVSSEEELNKYIELDKSYFNEVFGLNIDTYSFYNTTPFVLNCKNYTYGGLINVYADFFKECYQYRADNTGYWRDENFYEELNTTDIRHFQFLTHDAMWAH